jgi:hypothetical protein
MKLRFLGDSYDVVKHSLLRWLIPLGRWSTHPMFTERFTYEQKKVCQSLLGTRLLSSEVLALGVDRREYLAPAIDGDGHVFLDPDTGIRIKPTKGNKSPAYVFGPELEEIAGASSERLVLVFDQSLARGKERQGLEIKLSYFAEKGIHGFAYISHACFVLLGRDSGAVTKALKTLKNESNLPESRLLVIGP